MRTEKWRYTKVNPDGTLAEGGRINPKFSITNSIDNECSIEGCKCQKGYWISINLGVQYNSCAYGVTYYFDSKEDQINFILSN